MLKSCKLKEYGAVIINNTLKLWITKIESQNSYKCYNLKLDECK